MRAQNGAGSFVNAIAAPLPTVRRHAIATPSIAASRSTEALSLGSARHDSVSAVAVCCNPGAAS